MNCRKCGKELTGIAADHAHTGGDPLCGVSSCDEKLDEAATLISRLDEVIELLKSIDDRLK